MSSLTDAIDRTASEGLCAWPSFDADDADRCLVMLADHLRSLLAAHDAEIIAQAKREQMEEDCRAICGNCKYPSLEMVFWPGEWIHPGIGLFGGSVACHAEAIRAAYAKEHLEEAQGE